MARLQNMLINARMILVTVPDIPLVLILSSSLSHLRTLSNIHIQIGRYINPDLNVFYRVEKLV